MVEPRGLEVPRRVVRALAIVALLGLPLRIPFAAAQYAQITASPPLSADHWAVVAARRAEATGLIPGYLPAQRSVPRHVVGRALRQAAERAAMRSLELADLTEAWTQRFAEEFPEAALPAADGTELPKMLGSSAGLGYGLHEGRESPGIGEFPDSRTGSLPLPDRSSVSADVSVSLAVRPWMAISVDPHADADGVRITGGDLTLGWRSVALSVGRQPIGYGYGEGAVVLSGAAAMDRVQIETTTPLHLPGVLGYLGPVSFHTFLSRFMEERHVGEPWFWGASGSIRPHDRLTLSIHRATTIGGGPAPAPITARGLLYTFIGKHAGTLADQVVSAEFRYRAPTEELLPITLYLEWGAEDSAGSFKNVPGQVFGVLLPALPRLAAVGLGAEYARFEAACCGNPPWYRHNAHPGNWVLSDVPLGHAVGGNGTEMLVYTQADLLDARLRLDARAFRRERRTENLFVPGRDGSSNGVSGRASWRLGPRSDLMLFVARESGSDWAEREASVGMRVFF